MKIKIVKIKLGLKHFDTFEVEKSKSNLSVLTKKILDRKYPMINIDLKKWQLNHLTECIDQLQRYPFHLDFSKTKIFPLNVYFSLGVCV